VGYLITIGLAWFPWIIFDKKILGNDDIHIWTMILSILAWMFCMVLWVMRKNRQESLPIEDIFGIIGLGGFALGILSKILEVVADPFGVTW